MTPPKHVRIKKINAFTQARLIRLLLEGTYTCAELAEETGLHYVTVLDYTRELHRARAAFICAWEKDNRGRDATKIYKVGIGKDVARQSMTSAERTARYRAKKRAAQQALVLVGKAAFEKSRNGRVRFVPGPSTEA